MMTVRFKPYCFIAVMLMTALLCACGRPDDGSVTVDALAVRQASPEDVFEEEMPDTVFVAIDENAVRDEELSKIATEQEAVDYMRKSPDADKYAEGILGKMAKDNPDYAIRLLKNPYDYFIVVDKPSMFVVLFDRYGREVKAYKMACARNYGTKHKANDCRTPEGFFKAGLVYDSTDWLYTDENGYTSPTKGVYGKRFIRIANPVSNTIGIHGTNAPGSLGRRTSHGCVRIHPDKILELAEYVRTGMPIIVNPSVRDRSVNREEECEIPYINIGRVKETPLEEAKPKPDTVVAVPEQPVGPEPEPVSGGTEEPETHEDEPELEPSYFDRLI